MMCGREIEAFGTGVEIMGAHAELFYMVSLSVQLCACLRCCV